MPRIGSIVAVLGAVGALAAGCGGDPHPVATATATPPPARAHAARPAAPPPARGHYRGPVPILMYHVVASAPAGTPYPELWVPPRRFASQMERLKQAGYRGVTLAQVWAAWHGGPRLPRRPVVVSFDDGYFSQYHAAAPVLRRLGWPGVLNLEVHNLHVAGGLSARQVRALLAAGWELAAHSVSHPDLTTVDAARMAREVGGSRRALRRRFGVPVRFFAYPAGRYDAAAEQAVRAAGFAGATTTDPGLAARSDDRFALPRIRVLPGQSPAALLAAVQ